MGLDRLDGEHVVFGRVLDGMDFVWMAEGVGSASGHPHKEVRIADCGELPTDSELPLEGVKKDQSNLSIKVNS